jgi:hypothetical protein
MASEPSGNLVENALIFVVNNYNLVILVVEVTLRASACHVDGVLLVSVVGVRNVSSVVHGLVVVTVIFVVFDVIGAENLVPLELFKSPCRCNVWH